MQIQHPSVFQIFAAFDLLLDKLYPSIFPEGWLLNLNNSESRTKIHALIAEKLTTLPITTDAHDLFSINTSPKIQIELDLDTPDIHDKVLIDLPLDLQLPYRDLDPVKNQKKFHIIKMRLMKELLEKFSLTHQQGEKIFELHLAINLLYLKLRTHEKEGRLLFHTDYALSLLEKILPTLDPIQASRFYYWGILKFECAQDVNNWLSVESFRDYLNKFKD